MHKKAQKRHRKKKKRSLKTLRLLGEIKLYPATSAGSKNAPKSLPAYYPKNLKMRGQRYSDCSTRMSLAVSYPRRLASARMTFLTFRSITGARESIHKYLALSPPTSTCRRNDQQRNEVLYSPANRFLVLFGFFR